MNNIKPTKKYRKLSGIIVSTKMPKTLVVEVWRTKTHPKYKKQYKVSKCYKVHFDEGNFQAGDQVEFVACRPISKEKRWRVLFKK